MKSNGLALVAFAVLVAVGIALAAIPPATYANDSSIVSVTGKIDIVVGDFTPGAGGGFSKTVPGSNLTVYAVDVSSERRDGEPIRLADAQSMASMATAYAMSNESGKFTVHVSREFFNSGRSGALMVVYGAFNASRYYRVDASNVRGVEKKVRFDLTTH